MNGDLLFDTGAADALQRVTLERDELAKRIRDLLTRIALYTRPCKACGTELAFVSHVNGNLTPYTMDGVNHFANCPEAARFKSKSRTTPKAGCALDQQKGAQRG